MNRRWMFRGVIAIAGAVLLFTAYSLLAPRLIYARQRAVTLHLLDSADPGERSRGAWRTIEHDDPSMIPILVQRIMGDERDPQAREACVYALGKLADPAGQPGLLHATELDEAGFVRAAAWLALARVSPTAFYSHSAGDSSDPWRRLGIAQGRLELGDSSQLAELLNFALEGDESQRFVAAQALYKNLRPLLEAAGRWPLDAPVEQGEPWPADFVRDIAARCAALDMRSLAADTKRQLDRAVTLRNTLRRVTSARERIARWLQSN